MGAARSRRGRSGSTRSLSSSSRSGFEWTENGSPVDEPGAKDGNCRSAKSDRHAAFEERRIADWETLSVFDE